ncbi:MAG: FKBP-type peptidyl-prolyl cis-trans isomerase [Candidatus Hydrogenedentes bacterium]|nr:FKBP-type peptidyl-prolyl cis-trans isomerase [Candidatus Hydrogenedentota bacterium]
MRKGITGVLLAVLALSPLAAWAAEEAKPAPVELNSDVQKVSYSIGTQIGTSMKNDGIEIDIKAFVRGIEDARGGKPLALTQEQMQQVMTAFRQQMMQKIQAERAAAGEKAASEGAKFLEENGKKPGVKTLPSGLQYLVVTEGKGEMPKATDTVKTHYRGTLIDGKEFDSSYARNEPAEFPVDGVIPGWTEALQLMHVGDKWKLFIPANLAYGENGAGQDIPPNATLVFDIELLEIVKPEAGTIAIPPQQ